MCSSTTTLTSKSLLPDITPQLDTHHTQSSVTWYHAQPRRHWVEDKTSRSKCTESGPSLSWPPKQLYSMPIPLLTREFAELQEICRGSIRSIRRPHNTSESSTWLRDLSAHCPFNDLSLDKFNRFVLPHHTPCRHWSQCNDTQTLDLPTKKSCPNPTIWDIKVCRRWNTGRCTSDLQVSSHLASSVGTNTKRKAVAELKQKEQSELGMSSWKCPKGVWFSFGSAMHPCEPLPQCILK